MLPTPHKYMLVAGHGEGNWRLNAFDAALLDAGVGNLNLIKISSILPPGACYQDKLEIPPGSLTPTAYGSITSCNPGEEIAVAVAVGLPMGHSFGVIMEKAGICSGREIEEQVRLMIEAAFLKRGLALKEIKSRAVAHRVSRCGGVFAGVILWY